LALLKFFKPLRILLLIIIFLFAGMLFSSQSHLLSSQTERIGGAYLEVSGTVKQIASTVLLDKERLQNLQEDPLVNREGKQWEEP
jgi:hypothetical protein